MEKTHFKKLRNPNYIGSYELMTGCDPVELTVVIEKAIKELVQNGDKKEEAMVVYLKDQKPMIVNSTNAKSIASSVGSPYIEDWAGKKIILYVAKIKAFGEQVDALRVRKESFKMPELNSKHIKWNDAITALKAGNTTIEKIKISYTLSTDTEKLLIDAIKK
ncbi:MAG: hypothetical protein H7098_07790 [Oligoflexus sp.]|nr:hypothetical protein [Pseudopedobacter sp.]